MSERTIEDFEDEYEDIPDLEDVEESLSNPETTKRNAYIHYINRYTSKLLRGSVGVGIAFSVYIVLIKFPIVALQLDVPYISGLFDPVAGILLGMFGVLWFLSGLLSIWGGWCFYRVRKLQNTSSKRPVFHIIRGLSIMVTASLVLFISGAYLLAMI